MIPFMNEDFLLTNDTARKLYHDVAAKMPIVDYHCHLDARDIYEDVRFDNITRLWLGGDHYKWRILRSNGVDEYYITGSASDREKFQKFAEIMPRLIGSPVYHWAHLELQRYFGIDTPISGKSAKVRRLMLSQPNSGKAMTSQAVMHFAASAPAPPMAQR